MPELPEVHTTVEGINRVLRGKKIVDVWSAYNSPFHKGKDNIKNVHYFKNFREAIVGAKFLSATRRGKNILIHLSNGHTILIHMKMTGHLMYGEYKHDTRAKIWRAVEDGPLQDPFNQFIRLVFALSDASGRGEIKHLAFSDMRKFGKVFVFPTKELASLPELATLGPEPLESAFTFKIFKERLATWPRGKIKQVLLDQGIIAGIGNIYSDEILFAAGVHPLTPAEKIPAPEIKKMFDATKNVLKRGIKFGGDSESDYRNIDGVPGAFQLQHQAYRHTGEKCSWRSNARRSCDGIIERLKIGGRSAHFCPRHQKLFK
ncbi:MAG: bifunctional DNA-formamidopyrimidine glycosylase/DNA-(apurinic or apyrimidinic site) lyase [Patescibacteria group bacterium]